MTGIDLRKLSRSERLALPVASDVLENMVAERGGCIRPVLLRRTDRATGEVELLPVPCGASLASKCPACAKRKRSVRVQQCREGWHLAEEPEVPTEDPDEVQRWWVEQRSAVTTRRDRLAQQPDTDPAALEELDDLIADLDEEISGSGMRGHVDRTPSGSPGARRARSTRRREDVPELPKRPKNRATIGRAYTDPKNGQTFRPSLFITVTLDSYGPVRGDGTPVDPSTYDYVRAARDAIHFPKLIDRFIQNLRRIAGFDVQYFATVEPQRRLAPHLHLATRGTIPRAEVRQVVAATYHQVWWPSADHVAYEGDHVPVWDEDGGYLDPATGEVLPTWEQALDRLDADPDAEPFHVIRAGRQVDVKGVVAGSDDADRRIRYLSKYLTKTIGECHEAETHTQRDHTQRFLDVLRFEPCSPQCSNWLRYGVQPQGAKEGMRPGYCPKKAHRPEHLGYAGRRVLVSRKWSGKTLTDHKRDRLAYVLDLLGTNPDDEEGQDHGDGPPGRVSERVRQTPDDPYEWELAKPGQPGVPSRHQLLMHQLTDTITRRQQLEHAHNVTAGGAHSDHVEVAA